MNFAAIDFETATGYHNSACAVAIVSIQNGKIIDEYYSLIQPPENYFWRRFTQEIHGIHWRDTLNAPSIADLLPELKKRLAGQTVVAHNAPFDSDVLLQSLKYHHIDVTTLEIAQWKCTLEIYRNKGFKPAALNACCDRLGIPLNHHNALSDAKACAELFLQRGQH